jgi:hypothetical protein
MSTRDLIDAIASGNSLVTQQTFANEMIERIALRMDSMRQDVAKNMFKESVAELEEAAGDVHPDALHVHRVAAGKYKVHAVGKNFADGIKVGEHLNDSELDDFSEMGGRVQVKKAVKEGINLDEAADKSAPQKVHPNALHVQHVGGGKYKVHAVGKNFADGIKTGEHLNDSELDDFAEMGGKVKHVK